VDFFKSRKISARQFGTFATISVTTGREQIQHNCDETQSFDHFVGSYLQTHRNRKSKRFGGFEVNRGTPERENRNRGNEFDIGLMGVP
jgi:hypothetical protein